MSALSELIAKVKGDTWASRDYLELAEQAARDLAQIREALWALIHATAANDNDGPTLKGRKLGFAALSLLDGAPAKATVSVPVDGLSTDAIHTVLAAVGRGHTVTAATFAEAAQREVNAIDAALRSAEKKAE